MDLSASIQQLACDKLLGSVSYPFIAEEKHEPFPGCSSLAPYEFAPTKLTDQELSELFKESVAHVKAKKGGGKVTPLDEIYSFGAEIIEQSKKALDAAASADYEGPSKAELENILSGGIENLVQTMGDFDAYAHCSYIRVKIKNQPRIVLSSPRISLRGFNVEVKATGELWVKYPWLNCYKWCTKWEKVYKCKKVASLTAAPDLAIEAHVDFVTQGPVVYARAQFDRLRIDEFILREIPLEDFVNPSLKKRLVPIYDASKLVQTVPILESKFTVDAITLPQNPSGITVGVTLRQI